MSTKGKASAFALLHMRSEHPARLPGGKGYRGRGVRLRAASPEPPAEGRLLLPAPRRDLRSCSGIAPQELAGSLRRPEPQGTGWAAAAGSPGPATARVEWRGRPRRLAISAARARSGLAGPRRLCALGAQPALPCPPGVAGSRAAPPSGCASSPAGLPLGQPSPGEPGAPGRRRDELLRLRAERGGGDRAQRCGESEAGRAQDGGREEGEVFPLLRRRDGLREGEPRTQAPQQAAGTPGHQDRVHRADR